MVVEWYRTVQERGGLWKDKGREIGVSWRFFFSSCLFPLFERLVLRSSELTEQTWSYPWPHPSHGKPCVSAAENPLSAVQFAQTSPVCILGWPLTGSTYALVTTRLSYCNSFLGGLAAQLSHCAGESWECTPTSRGWIAVIKLPLCLLYVGSLKES